MQDVIEVGDAVSYRYLILDGVGDEIDGRLKIVKGLLALKEGDLWKDDPLVAHIENPRWKDDYLAELIQWMKEENPSVQAGLSTLQNYMKYYKVFVGGFGLDEELVFGATENTRRHLFKMCDWEYGGGEPKRLRNGYDLDKLPLPPEFTGEEPPEERLVAGVKEVAKQAFSLGRYSPDLFEAYEHGDGNVKVSINMRIMLDKNGLPYQWTAFIKKTDPNGEPLGSYAADLLNDQMPVEALDWLEKRGFTVEMDM